MTPRPFLLAAALLLCAGRAAAEAPPPGAPASPPPGREVSLPPSEVKDTFFAYVLGVIHSGIDIDIDNAGMRAVLTEFRTALSLPFDLVSRVIQRTEPGGARTIDVDFSRPVTIPIPFALLFYHPGSIVAAQDLTFDVAVEGTPAAPAYVLELSSGTVLINIDDWLEVLLRAYLEDTWIRHLVFFTWRGDWLGLLEGRGRRTDRQVRAYFNFTHNMIVFPTPAALDQVARAYVP